MKKAKVKSKNSYKIKYSSKKVNIKRATNGITLIALIVTIIVFLILAGVSIATLTGDSGIITRANEAKVATELTGIKEEVEYSQILIDEEGQQEVRYMTTKEVNEKFPNIPDQYKGKIGLYRNQPVYLGKEDEEMSKIAERYGYRVINMTEDEFSYYVEMGIVEDSIIENASKKIGRELSTSDFPETIKIGDNEYSTGWYLIGNYTEEEKNNNTYGNQFEELGIKDTTHAPYIVNYETGSILSVEGMIMYQAEIAVHTFQDNNYKLTNAITYVGDTSVKNGDYYGNLYTTSLYNGPISNEFGAKYDDNGGKLEYDENGALVLDEDNAIPVLEVDEKYQINDSYSINVTLEGELYYDEGGNYLFGDYASTITALSDVESRYICWIGVYKGYLHVYSYDDFSEVRRT